MNRDVESSVITDALDKYLPELSSGTVRDRIRAVLRDTLERSTHTGSACETLSTPTEYDPAQDADGRFRDYFDQLAKPWSEKVAAELESSAAVAVDNSIAQDFHAHLMGQMSLLMMRTLLAELYRMRSTGLLAGDTPEDRYRSFRAWTNSPVGQAELESRYPVLCQHVRQRADAVTEYLRHVVDEVQCHRAKLGDLLGVPEEDLRITQVALGEGDTHNGGRSVARVQFTTGDIVLYKPHPMEAEQGYHEFVRWMNDQLDTDLPTIWVLPTGQGGFAEFVRTDTSQGTEDRYFSKIGQVAGILWLLRATDIHYENVVCGSNGPVVVDAETLLTPTLRRPQTYADGAASQLASRMILESVIGIGLLPLLVKARDSDTGLDIGAIGYDSGQMSPFKTLIISNPGRDDMCIEMASVELTGANANLTVSRAAAIPVRTQRDIIKDEFRRVLEFAWKHPEQTVSAVERCLGRAKFRYVNAPTVFYSQLARMATHPSAFADPVVRAAVLNRVALRTGEAHLIAAEEARQLDRGDIPYFCYASDSPALCNASGEVVQTDALEKPPMEAVRSRIRSLDDSVVDHELHLIDLAFVNKLPTDREPTGFSALSATAAVPPADRARMVSEAVRIGDLLVASMVDGPDRNHPATWIAPQVTTSSQSQWLPGTLGYDLYGGTAGVALGLAGLAHQTGDQRYAEAAMRVFGPIERQICDGVLDGLPISVGGMTGMAGTVFALVTAKRLLGDALQKSPGELAGELAKRADAEPKGDFTGGLAGTLAVCLMLHRVAADGPDRKAAEDAARTIADYEVELLSEGVSTGRITDYTGYAHGALGIAPVLLEHGTLFDDARCRRIGLRAIEAFVSVYDPTDRDWPRRWDGDDRSYAWCHGAPGLLLGALQALRHQPSCVPQQMVSRLVELTTQRGFGNNPTYCHGDLSSAEILLQAERQYPGLTGGATAHLYPRLFVDVVERYELRFDSKYAFTNSLMAGQSGLLWSILRHLGPDDYPSILTFS